MTTYDRTAVFRDVLFILSPALFLPPPALPYRNTLQQAAERGCGERGA